MSTDRKEKLEKALAQKTSWGEWWFINGGQLHSYWKNKKYSAIRDAANRLPRAAWEYQENEIQRLAPLHAALIEAIENLEDIQAWCRDRDASGAIIYAVCLSRSTEALAKIDEVLEGMGGE